jgi:hypothetical protein
LGGRQKGNSRAFELLTAGRIGQGRQSAAFSVVQAQAATRELRFENAIFFFEVDDDLLLVPIDPAGNHDDKDLQSQGGSSGWQRRYGSMQPTTNLRKINTVPSADYFNRTARAVVAND